MFLDDSFNEIFSLWLQAGTMGSQSFHRGLHVTYDAIRTPQRPVPGHENGLKNVETLVIEFKAIFTHPIWPLPNI